MKFKVEINMENAAFGEGDAERSHAVSVILENLAYRIVMSQEMRLRDLRIPLFDANGNTVGAATVEG